MDIQTMNQPPADLEALLSSLTAAEAAESDPVVEAVLAEKEAEDAALSDVLLDQLEAITARAEAYESQSAGADVADATTAVTQKASKKAKEPKAPKQAKAPKAPAAQRKTLADLDEAEFRLFTGSTPDKAFVISLRPRQVKVAEKFDNLFLSMAAGKLPSGYVVTAIKTLAKTSTMTSADLVGVYKAEGLGDGTARSQTGQIMELFSVVGIATRSGQSLQARLDSEIAQRLMTLINAQPAQA